MLARTIVSSDANLSRKYIDQFSKAIVICIASDFSCRGMLVCLCFFNVRPSNLAITTEWIGRPEGVQH